ncbi:hypothetical protein H072_10988 [Dactylellina haptotyla CBS 200.50]|uniref:PBP domain-containing protein n=1 Tax=Dactylellina haptotyla (strain CBS 200.50) TaxID=1284197 RepID=S7ZXU6_DACHA|nr:hypothetical protein H072_10988 [Dactylellina haptotyla CBS 200.50]
MVGIIRYVGAALVCVQTLVYAVDPQAVYDGGIYGNNGEILLRIGNGGAGQSGLIKELADKFIQYRVKNGAKPFKVAWYLSDTTVSINYLKDGVVDVGFTYSETAEKIAIAQGVAIARYYSWRDHFLLVGPKENPAKVKKTDDILTIFSDIYEAAQANTANATVPTRFLSRYDKSATNIKESQLWIGIGQVPWATAYSTWYHTYIAFPIQALTAAALLKEYTITDRGTYLSVDPSIANQTVIYKAATDNATDPLLNPAFLLVGKKATNLDVVDAFRKWVVGKGRGEGQKVITAFKKNGQQLYTGAP